MHDPADIPFVAVTPRAALWIEQLITGSVATLVATIAVALLGFSMLSGRLDLKAAFRVVLGCFIIFNAAALADGVSHYMTTGGFSTGASSNLVPSALPSKAPAFDPYAGASTPH